ncbi:MAG: hypothetical protein AB1778_09140 [Candidatus Bipolaricaulota bacterium]
MSRSHAAIAALVVLAAVVALVFRLAPPLTSGDRQPSTAAGLKLRGYDDQGNVSWEAAAERGELVSETGELAPAELTFFSDDAPWLTVRAERLERTETGGTLDGVSLLHDVGFEIVTDRMTWRESAGRLEAGRAEIRSGDDGLVCESLAIDTKAERATLSAVTAKLARGEVFDVTATAGEVTGERVTLFGGVGLQGAAARASASSLETKAGGSEARLSGEVSAEAEGWRLEASELAVAEKGWTARGAVRVEVDLASLGGEDGP